MIAAAIPQRAMAGFSALLLAAAAGGCGRTQLNTGRGERKIADIVRQRTGERVTVSCPRDVPLRQDERTTCTITGRDGSHAAVRMIQTDDKGNVRVSSMLMATADVEGKVARDASRKLRIRVTIDCPDIVDVTGEARVRCVAKDATGRTAPAFVTISARGSVSYRIPPAG